MSNNILPVSVIMSVYNSEKYLRESIESILNQTFIDFEFIITDDASDDKSLNIIKEYQSRDERIILICNKENIGLTKSLNNMLKISRGKYIARMDADDISLPNRFACQINFMDNHPDYIVCGTFAKYFGNKTTSLSYIYSKNEDIKLSMYYNCPFVHPSVFIRKSILVENNIFYNDNYNQSQDYKLWVDLHNYGKFHNINKYLFLYMDNDNQISKIKKNPQINYTIAIRKELINEYLQKKITTQYTIPNRITLGSIKELKSIIMDKDKHFSSILLCYYLSIKNFNIKILIYFLLSLDFLRLSIRNNIRIVTKFFINSKYNII